MNNKKAIHSRKYNLKKKKKNLYLVVSMKMRRVKQISRKEVNRKKTKTLNNKRLIKSISLSLIM